MATDTPPSTFPRDVIAWLTANPGRRRPTEVAAGLGVDTARAANTLAYLARAGKVRRHRDPDRPNGPGSSTYTTI